MPETKDFRANCLKHFVGPGPWTFFELLRGKEPEFLTLNEFRNGSEWSTEESYLLPKEVVVPNRMVNDCAERSLALVTDCHIDRITRSKKQKFQFYQVVTKLGSMLKKLDEKKGLSKKFIKQMNYLF